MALNDDNAVVVPWDIQAVEGEVDIQVDVVVVARNYCYYYHFPSPVPVMGIRHLDGVATNHAAVVVVHKVVNTDHHYENNRDNKDSYDYYSAMMIHVRYLLIRSYQNYSVLRQRLPVDHQLQR